MAIHAIRRHVETPTKGEVNRREVGTQKPSAEPQKASSPAPAPAPSPSPAPAPAPVAETGSEDPPAEPESTVEDPPVVETEDTPEEPEADAPVVEDTPEEPEPVVEDTVDTLKRHGLSNRTISGLKKRKITLPQLLEAHEAGKLTSLPGIGKKQQKPIAAALDKYLAPHPEG